nr:immunoglobulin heavy chain junction region [Macaca mulatta]
CAKIGDSLDVW